MLNPETGRSAKIRTEFNNAATSILEKILTQLKPILGAIYHSLQTTAKCFSQAMHMPFFDQ
jgi:hypothetical protein